MPGKSHGQRALWATVGGVTKSWTQLSEHTHNLLQLKIFISDIPVLDKKKMEWSGALMVETQSLGLGAKGRSDE